MAKPTAEQKAKWKAAGKKLAERDAPRRKEQNRRDLIMFVIGGVLILLGVIITVVTYTRASSQQGGGTYVVMYGPIVAGLSIVGTAIIGRS